jgi:hypothetical protein
MLFITYIFDISGLLTSTHHRVGNSTKYHRLRSKAKPKDLILVKNSKLLKIKGFQKAEGN